MEVIYLDGSEQTRRVRRNPARHSVEREHDVNSLATRPLSVTSISLVDRLLLRGSSPPVKSPIQSNLDVLGTSYRVAMVATP